MNEVSVERFADASAFLACALAWLMRNEAENNVIVSIAAAVSDGQLVPKQPPYFAVALVDDAIDACAMRTPPHKLVVSRGSDAAMQALARDTFHFDPRLPAVIGPEPSSSVFAAAWSAQSGVPTRLGTRQRLHVAEAVAEGLPHVAGILRQATQDDRALALDWAHAFGREAMPHEPFDREEIVDRLLRLQRLFFWDDAGSPVAMLAASGKTLHGARVGLVYTPPALRRRGYATAAVAALTRRLLHEGNRHCCLYTDLANPTSNSVYRKVGYRPVCDVNDHLLAE